MEKKSPTKDVYLSIKQDLPELYKKLVKEFGEENPFAKFSIGAGYYVWSDNRCKWDRMIDACELDQALIREAISKKQDEIATKVGTKTAEALFTTPDDSYIYYNDEHGIIKILIAGWGFKKPVRVRGGNDVTGLSKKNPVDISFSYDGKKLGNYEFGLKLSQQVKRLETDGSGIYHFDNLKVGKHFIVIDVKNGKEYPLDITDGQSEYDFDITRYSTLYVSALQDGEPITDEEIDINYNGTSYNTRTNSLGKASIKLPHYDDKQIIASIREKQQTGNWKNGECHLDFAFETERTSCKTERTSCKVVVTVTKNGIAVQNSQVSIEYAGRTYTGITDVQGALSQEVTIIDDNICCVSVPDFTPQSKNLNGTTETTFRFDKTDPPKHDTPFNAHLHVIRENGTAVHGHPIIIEHNGKKESLVTDVDGNVQLTDVEEGQHITAFDGRNATLSQEYKIDKQQREYIFTLPNEDITDARKIMVTFKDLNGLPITCDSVCFKQENHDDLSLELDDFGTTYFDDGTFTTSVPMMVSINGWKPEQDYEDIPFTLDEGEYEYLIQEKKAKISWQNIIWQIIVVLLTAIILLGIVWPFFEKILMKV